ncbi:cysteine proteinase [Dendrothele bispora CBS 962.96]|uniref:Cysteine proteinase n=1 Tax=Dendrothele bispora (strain CBS 962.96) TaxID=1314807 RepID=A0A4V4HCJ1_DENBC|nr:cysteine proteinase [Dendrothele bispora CBS 962.96]
MPTGTMQNGSPLNIRQKSSPYSKEQVLTWLDAIGFWTARDGSCDGINSKDTENVNTIQKANGSTEIGKMGQTFIDTSGVAIDLPPPTLENLNIITRLYLVAFPFESTTIHYSTHHSMDVSPQGLYQRLVIERNGSYCYGLNGLLLWMLLGMGYRAYSGQARVNTTPNGWDTPRYIQMSHMVLFVQPMHWPTVTNGDTDATNNARYLVDVGFGGGGLTRPMLLDDREDNFILGTGPTERHRLRRGPLEIGSVVGEYSLS